MASTGRINEIAGRDGGAQDGQHNGGIECIDCWDCWRLANGGNLGYHPARNKLCWRGRWQMAESQSCSRACRSIRRRAIALACFPERKVCLCDTGKARHTTR